MTTLDVPGRARSSEAKMKLRGQRARSLLASHVKIGSVWLHYKGGLYRVLAVACVEDDPLEIVIVYRSLERRNVWSRPIFNFYAHVLLETKPVIDVPFRMVGDNYRCRRFTRVGAWQWWVMLAIEFVLDVVDFISGR